MVQAIQVARLFVQGTVFALLNARLFGVAPLNIPVPFLQPSGAPYSVVRGAYDDFEGGLSHSEFPLLALGVTLLTAITVGKLLCAWACPFGFIQDLIALPFTIKKSASKGAKKSANTAYVASDVISEKKARQLRDIKWAVLGFTLIWCFVNGSRRAAAARFAEEQEIEDYYPKWVLSDAPFSTLSPAATLFAYVPWLAMWNPSAIVSAGIIAWIKLGLVVAFVIAAAYVPRFFCRFVCPMGAVFEPFTNFKMLRITKDASMSDSMVSEVLEKNCPMGVTQYDTRSNVISHPNCIHCGRCTAASPLLKQKFF